jgi:DASS family divalent anion:Na+ symporter
LNEWWVAGAVMSAVNLLLLVLVGGIWWTMLGYIANG